MAIDPNRWTVKTQEAFNAAVERARTANHPEVGPTTSSPRCWSRATGSSARCWPKVGVDAGRLATTVSERLAKLPRAYGSEAGMGRDLRAVLERADTVRTDLRDDFVSTEHLILGMPDLVGATTEELLDALKSVRGNQRVTNQDPEATFKALEKFGRDLTAVAREGKLDPVIGRDEEIRRVIQVLSRRTKNNPVLIGEPGVGKTAIVEGLARASSRATSPRA
jgi:ATP-dependent Clp protease ATP-binding subunit ClpB